MGATRKVILELPEEDAALLDELVRSGAYPSNAASVSAALSMFRSTEVDPELEQWVEQVGIPLLAEIDRDSSQLLTPEEFDRELESHRLNRRAAKAR